MGSINWGITQEEYNKLSVGDTITLLEQGYDGPQIITGVIRPYNNFDDKDKPWTIDGASFNIKPHLGGTHYIILNHEPKPPEWHEAKVIKGTTDYFVRNDDGDFVNCQGHAYEVGCFRDPTIIVDKDGNVRA